MEKQEISVNDRHKNYVELFPSCNFIVFVLICPLLKGYSNETFSLEGVQQKYNKSDWYKLKILMVSQLLALMLWW